MSSRSFKKPNLQNMLLQIIYNTYNRLSDFHIIDSLLIAVHAFVNLVSMSFSVDSTLLPR